MKKKLINSIFAFALLLTTVLLSGCGDAPSLKFILVAPEGATVTNYKDETYESASVDTASFNLRGYEIRDGSDSVIAAISLHNTNINGNGYQFFDKGEKQYMHFAIYTTEHDATGNLVVKNNGEVVNPIASTLVGLGDVSLLVYDEDGHSLIDSVHKNEDGSHNWESDSEINGLKSYFYGFRVYEFYIETNENISLTFENLI